jgi:hypothetical protein
MEPGADGFGAHRMRKGKVPDDITCCFFSFDQICFRADRQKARASDCLESYGLEIAA